MCLIAYRNTPGSHIPNNVIEYNLKSNPDGFGIAWRDPEAGVQFVKFAPTESAEFVSLLKKIDRTDMVYAAHWRTGTAGPKNRDLAHPFPYTDKDGNSIIAFHNGIIGIKAPADESDTSTFVKHVLSDLPYKWWDSGALRFLVESSVGWSRMLLMTVDEDIFINEDQWRRDNGILYSTSPGPVVQTGKWLPTVYGGGAALGGKSFRSGWEAAPSIDIEEDEEVDEEDDEKVLLTGHHLSGRSVPKWYHKGHPITPMTQIDSGSDDYEDRYGVVQCDECCTDGEYFVIDGTLHIDLDHEPMLNWRKER